MDNFVPDVCIYHGDCLDGFTSAYLVQRKWLGNTVKFYKGEYGAVSFSPTDFQNKNVLFVDFSLSRFDTIAMSDFAKKIVIIDHHKTAEQNLINLPQNVVVYFDMSECGASYTKKLLEIHLNENEYNILERVKDRDLWTQKYNDTKYVFNVMASMKHTFDNWDKLFSTPLMLLVEKGESIQSYRDSVIEFIKKNAWVQKDWRGYENIPVANCPRIFASEVLNDLAVGHPFAVSYHDKGNKKEWSLRSIKGLPTSFDVSEVAKKFGGGGHAEAAGFVESI